MKKTKGSGSLRRRTQRVLDQPGRHVEVARQLLDRVTRVEPRTDVCCRHRRSYNDRAPEGAPRIDHNALRRVRAAKQRKEAGLVARLGSCSRRGVTAVTSLSSPSLTEDFRQVEVLIGGPR
jgi:hypothetical protein